VAFLIDFARPWRRAPDAPLELRIRNPTPAFTALVPEERQAAVDGGLRVSYPTQMQRGGFAGHVVLQFVVDTTGRAIPSTVRDANAGAERALRPELRPAYRTFLEAAKQGVVRSRFRPAEIGGCRVRQRVQQPVTFDLR
jgi:hypothetical protein